MHRPAPARSNFGLIIGLIAVVALLIGLVAGLSIVLLGKKDGAATAVTTPPPELQAITQAATTQRSDAAPATETTLTPRLTQPTAPALVSSPADAAAQIEALRLAREAAEAKAAAEAEAAAKMPSVIDWLSSSRITGVKVAPGGNRVILNGKTYTEGEYVNFELGLKVLIVEETRVLFADDAGKKYMKRL